MGSTIVLTLPENKSPQDLDEAVTSFLQAFEGEQVNRVPTGKTILHETFEFVGEGALIYMHSTTGNDINANYNNYVDGPLASIVDEHVASLMQFLGFSPDSSFYRALLSSAAVRFREYHAKIFNELDRS